MITEKSKKLIGEEMLSLPKEAQDAINDSDWEKISEEIGKKHLLNENEINAFQLETASFLLGLIDEDSYALNIENNVGTSAEEAEKINNEINQKIFTPISEKLIENIKKVGKDKNPNWQQSLDFIMSGGDYSAFISNRENTTSPAPIDTQKPKVPMSPRKITDLKSKFTI